MNSPIPFAPLAVINNIIADIYNPIKATVGIGRDKLLVSMQVSFSNYYEEKYEKFGKVKTILYPLIPSDLDAIYLPPRLQWGRETIHSEEFLEAFDEMRFCAITGIAGQGKSLFARKIFREILSDSVDTIPIFIEMRDLNSKDFSISQMAYEEFSSSADKIPKSAFDGMILGAGILFILDGFDEVSPSKRLLVLREVLKLLNNNNKLKIIITSRSGEVFNGIAECNILSIISYDNVEAGKIIDRSSFPDKKIKEEFILKIEENYFDGFQEFLGNPLLLSMMLLTFSRGGDVPAKRSLFFKKAFDALFNVHDDLKTLYKREFHCGLLEDDFKRVWSSFCFISYMERDIVFENDNLLDLIKRGAEFVGIEVDARLLIKDLIESCCVLLQDGDEISFLHRSFQEYFCATFLLYEEVEDVFKYIGVACKRINDDVMKLMIDINPDNFGFRYLVPLAESIIKERENRDRILFMSKFYISVCFEDISDGMANGATTFIIDEGSGAKEFYHVEMALYILGFSSYEPKYKETAEWLSANPHINRNEFYDISLNRSKFKGSPLESMGDTKYSDIKRYAESYKDRKKDQRKLVRPKV